MVDTLIILSGHEWFVCYMDPIRMRSSPKQFILKIVDSYEKVFISNTIKNRIIKLIVVERTKN